MRRFVASDVMWEDLFRVPSVATLRQEGIAGVEVPQSVFLTRPTWPSARATTPVLDRIRGASDSGTPTGLHGTSLVRTRALPSGQVLRTDEDDTIVATADLAFEATVENSATRGGAGQGDARVEQSPRPIEKTATIDLIDAGERKTSSSATSARSSSSRRRRTSSSNRTGTPRAADENNSAELIR